MSQVKNRTNTRHCWASSVTTKLFTVDGYASLILKSKEIRLDREEF